MRKITFLIALFMVSIAYSQELLTNGDFETGDITGWAGNAANVVTENGNSYNAANVATAGDPWAVNLHQVVSLTAGKKYKLVFDAWSDTNRTIIAGIGLNEAPWSAATETINLTATSQSITLTLVAPATNTNSRMLFDMGGATGFVGIDNVSLKEDASDGGGVTPPSTAAPTPPARSATDVVSIYSDAYTDITTDNFDAGWCGGAAATEITIAGNNTLQKNAGIDCHGIDFSTNRQDLSDFTHLHFDFYVGDTDLTGDVFNVKLVDFAGGGGEASALEVNINGGTTPALVANTWVSVDIDITSLTAPVAGSLTRNDIAQIGITTANVTNVWYDNIYLYKGAPASTSKFDFTEIKAYPNPVESELIIQSTSKVTNIRVYNILGKQVQVAKTLTSNSLNVSDLKSGMYILKFDVDGVTGTKKFMKK